MTDLEPKDAAEKCNARKSDGSGYCQHRAGWGTDHVGHGRCRYHGGNTQNQEKSIIDDLEAAGGDAATVYKLKLKHIRERVEAGEFDDIDWNQFDKLGTSALDRIGHGPSETKKHRDESDGAGFGSTIVLDSEYVDDE